MKNKTFWISDETAKANARLIAAAPELLAALLDAHGIIQYAKNKPLWLMGGDFYVILGRIDKTICKALGEDYESIKTEDFKNLLAKVRGES